MDDFKGSDFKGSDTPYSRRIEVDSLLLAEFEDRLNPAYPEKSGIVPTILGYGEISTSFCIEQMPDIAFKRMPPFASRDAAENYRGIVADYTRRLSRDCGVRVIAHSIHIIENRLGEYIAYVSQPRLEKTSIGNVRLKQHGAREMRAMVSVVTKHLLEIGRKNHCDPEISIGIDGQISNWSFSGENPSGEDSLYFDITTPLIRLHGTEQLDTGIFLKSMPSMLVWVVRWKFLHEVLDRYYDTRQVLIDLVANFHKEGRAEMIDEAIGLINEITGSFPSSHPVAPLTRREVDIYYKHDAFIWTVLLKLRRMDRFIRTKVLRKRYNFILPGKIIR
jgi:hypothetical protein